MVLQFWFVLAHSFYAYIMNSTLCDGRSQTITLNNFINERLRIRNVAVYSLSIHLLSDSRIMCIRNIIYEAGKQNKHSWRFICGLIVKIVFVSNFLKCQPTPTNVSRSCRDVSNYLSQILHDASEKNPSNLYILSQSFSYYFEHLHQQNKLWLKDETDLSKSRRTISVRFLQLRLWREKKENTKVTLQNSKKYWWKNKKFL